MMDDPPDDGQRNCPKHVEFYSRNKFEKLVHLVGLIVGNILSFYHQLAHTIPVSVTALCSRLKDMFLSFFYSFVSLKFNIYALLLYLFA
jgi:hypothetical protein